MPILSFRLLFKTGTVYTIVLSLKENFRIVVSKISRQTGDKQNVFLGRDGQLEIFAPNVQNDIPSLAR